MKRFLRMMCLYSLCPLTIVACGDDTGGGDQIEDGGVHFVDENDFNDAVGDLSGDIDDIGDAIDGLGTDVGDLNDQLGEVGDELDAVGGRLDDLENPEIGSCSAEEVCIPDGLDLVETNMREIVAALCEREIGCCSEDELNLKFGPGITTADQCTDTFIDLINNGLSPHFLDDSAWMISYVIEIIRLLNDPAVRVEVDQAGVAACVEFLEAQSCEQDSNPSYDEGARCLAPEAGAENPCSLDALTNGLQEAGELCDAAASVEQCAEGLTCRASGSDEGICASIAEAGDRCVTDSDCDDSRQEMFCNKSTGECQARGDVGDDCAYIDGTFSYNSSALNPRWDNAHTWSPTAYASFLESQSTSIDCRTGTVCSPETFTCVSNCGEDAICANNADCPEGFTCNFGLNDNLYGTFSHGTCQTALAVGDECMMDSECASNRCWLNGAAYECHESLPVGSDCATPGPDDSCESFWCGWDGTCSARCNSNDECADTHWCDNDVYIDENQPWYPCERRGSIPNASDCDGRMDETHEGNWTHFECESGRCVDGACADKLGNGGVCDTLADCPTTHYCHYDLLAAPPLSTCQPVIAVGQDCAGADAGECGIGNYCDGVTEVCTVYAQQGEDCASTECDPYAYDEEANSGLGCYSYPSGGETCEYYGLLPAGAYCEGGCASGRCNEVNSDWICQERLAEGEACVLGESWDDHENGGCEDDLFCKTPDSQTNEGECAPKGTAGQSCDPWREGYDCWGNWGSCTLRNDGFFCNQFSFPPDAPLFCGSPVEVLIY